MGGGVPHLVLLPKHPFRAGAGMEVEANLLRPMYRGRGRMAQQALFSRDVRGLGVRG